MAGKIKYHTIQHLDSGHKEKLTEAEYEALQPRVKEIYKITDTQEIAEPAEVKEK